MNYLKLVHNLYVAKPYNSGHFGGRTLSLARAIPWHRVRRRRATSNLAPSAGLVAATVRYRCLQVLLNGLLLGAELEKVSSHHHGFERAPGLDHVVLCERGLAFFRRLWARC